MNAFVDAHQCAESLARADAPEQAALRRDDAMKDVLPLHAQAGVTAVVLVQDAPLAAQTRAMLEIARASDGLVRGVVAWVDLTSRDAIPALARLARNPLVKGVRPMPGEMDDERFLARGDVDRVLDALPRLGLRLDACATPASMPSLLSMLGRHPDLAVVVDHAGRPAIASGERAPWESLVREVATHPRARCKLSGLVTQAGPGWTIDGLRPWFDSLVEAFGPERLMWGSEWPVVNATATYQSWYAATVALTAGWSSDDRASLMGNTARRFYGL